MFSNQFDANNLVSIIMAAYNGERHIGQAIESVQSQSYPNWELIIVDDGSTDGTADVVHAVSDSRIHYVFQNNKGASAARNIGLRLSSGVYVAVLDADDMLTPDSLLSRACYLNQNAEIDAAYGDGYYCDARARHLLGFSEYRVDNPSGDIYGKLINSCFLGTGATVMLRRAFLARTALVYDESLSIGDDWDFWVRVAETAAFAYVSYPSVLYRLHGTNITITTTSERRLDSILRMKRKILESQRFHSLSASEKIPFLYTLLVQDLRGRWQEQSEIVNHPRFLGLPPTERARLLRLAAAEHLLTTSHIDVALDWLEIARKLAPWDPKGRILYFTARLSVRLASSFLKMRRRGQCKAAPSPFQLAALVESSEGT